MTKAWQRWVAQLFKNLGYRSTPGKIHATNKISTHFPSGLQMKQRDCLKVKLKSECPLTEQCGGCHLDGDRRSSLLASLNLKQATSKEKK